METLAIFTESSLRWKVLVEFKKIWRNLLLCYVPIHVLAYCLTSFHVLAYCLKNVSFNILSTKWFVTSIAASNNKLNVKSLLDCTG